MNKLKVAFETVFGMVCGVLLSAALVFGGCDMHLFLTQGYGQATEIFTMWVNQLYWLTPLCSAVGAVVGACAGRME